MGVSLQEEERTQKDTQMHREDHVKMEPETGETLPQTKEHRGHQKLQEAREDPPLEPSEGVWPR